MKIGERIFKIVDIDCEIIIEVVNRQKDILDWLDNYIENFHYDFFATEDESFEIIYKNGETDYISSDYDGHRIKRNNILSMVYNNACTAMVYGGFEINEYGVVSAANDVKIANENIIEVA